jgi:hypothetical protein
MEDLARELALLVRLCSDGDDLLLREAAGGVDEGALLLGELEVDHGRQA